MKFRTVLECFLIDRINIFFIVQIGNLIGIGILYTNLLSLNNLAIITNNFDGQLIIQLLWFLFTTIYYASNAQVEHF